MADTQISKPAIAAAPADFLLADAIEFQLKTVNAHMDGSGSAGMWLPCVTIKSDSGHVVARAVDTAVVVGAGGSADVSWFPCVKHRAAGVTTPTCRMLGSANGTTTLVIPLTVAVPGNGILHVVFCQATIGDASDTGSAPTAVHDSQAVAGWILTTAVKPLIGFTREVLTGSGPATTSQVGSIARPCTTGDLGIGDTVTVTFTSASPLLFHSAALVVWQHAYWTTITQFGANTYGNNDTFPSIGVTPARLSWDDDFGPGSTTPDEDGLMLTAMGAYPAVAGFSPFFGSKIGEIASGAVSIAAACGRTPEATSPDPGGTWPANAIQLLGNYQYALPHAYS